MALVMLLTRTRLTTGPGQDRVVYYMSQVSARMSPQLLKV